MGEGLTVLVSPDPHTRPSPRRCSQTLATMVALTHCPRTAIPRRSAPRTEPKGRAAPIEHWAALSPPPRPSQLSAAGDYLTPPLEPGDRILESQKQTWTSISDQLLTASRDCRRKRRRIKIAPRLPQIVQLNSCGLLNSERCTQTSSKLTFIEYFPCAKALC